MNDAFKPPSEIPANEAPPQRRLPVSIVVWIVIVWLTGLGLTIAVWLTQSYFRRLHEEFGSSLPSLTILALHPLVPVVLAVLFFLTMVFLIAGSVVALVLRNHDASVRKNIRRIWLALFGFEILVGVAYFVAANLPTFQLLDALG